MTSDYIKALKAYPRNMSLEQMRIVCHISKKTARRLLQTGLVPSENTGKKTHTYLIKKSDVREYLIQRDITPEKYAFGEGNYNVAYSKAMLNAKSDLAFTSDGENDGSDIVHNNLSLYKTYPDVLSSKQAAFLAGVTISAINGWARKKYLKAFLKSGAWHIPKSSLIEYIQSPRHKFNSGWKENQFAKQRFIEGET